MTWRKKIKKTDEPKEEASVKEEKFDKEIKIDDELQFQEFNIKMKPAKVYEKDGNYYADISFRWLNHTGGEAKLFRATSLDVKQSDELLEEVDDAWQDTNSDVHFPNANNGERGIELTYELVNKEDPVEITFVPANFELEEDSQTITIDID